MAVGGAEQIFRAAETIARGEAGVYGRMVVEVLSIVNGGISAFADGSIDLVDGVIVVSPDRLPAPIVMEQGAGHA